MKEQIKLEQGKTDMENEYREYVTFNITASDGFDVEKIGREFEYKRIAEDYMAMED